MHQIRNTWLKEEDEIILEFVMTQGLKKWTKIAKTIKERLGIDTRTGKQCRERWNNNLNPEITKETWSDEEVSRIFELQEQLGNKWSEIATHLPGRTDNSIKNCFYSAVRRNLRKYNRKRPESEKLKGSLKNLLRKPISRAILMDQTDQKCDVVKPIKIEKCYLKEDNPFEIVCPVVSPINPIGFFAFPFTPNTTPKVEASHPSRGFCSFPFEENSEVSGYCPGVSANEGFFFENYTPSYFLNQMSPSGSFEFFMKPRNSGSN